MRRHCCILEQAERRSTPSSACYSTDFTHRFCCTTAQNKTETVLLRSYEPVVLDKDHYTPSATNNIMRDPKNKITISLAARATSAAPTFFPEVNFPIEKPFKQLTGEEKLKNLVFWDGGLLNNNPIDQLWYARYELVQHVEPAPSISCVISLGTGFIKAESPASAWFHLTGVVSSVLDFSTNTNAKGKDFTRHMNRLKARSEHTKSQYIRLQPKLDVEIGLAEYDKMGKLKEITEAYIGLEKSQEWINKAVCAICCSGCSDCEKQG